MVVAGASFALIAGMTGASIALSSGPAGATACGTPNISTCTATGTLTILPDFAFYLGKYFNTAQLTQSNVTSPNANFAGDGMPNLMKYALGLDPTKPDAAAGAPVVGQSGGFQTLTYLCPPGLTDVTYVVQVSSDLVTWNSGPSFTTTISNSLVGNQQQVVVRDLTPTSGTTRRFIRLEITQP